MYGTAFTSSQIGVILRDSNGIAQVRAITGSKILRVLKANGKRALEQGQEEHHGLTKTVNTRAVQCSST